MSRALPLALLAVLAAACTGPQGVLRNEGPAARVLSELWWRLFFTTVIPAALVILFVVWLALRKKAEVQPPAPGRDVRFIVVAGALFPGAVLLMLTVFTIQAGEGTRRPPREPALRVEVIGHQFWWEVRYPDHDVVTANEIHVPAGEPVQLEVTSADVIHSFWVPALHGKIDMIPGKTNVFWFQADRPGEYRGQCAEFCGQQHALMALLVVAEPADALQRWLAAQREPAPLPTDEALQRGLVVYREARCDACHNIRGVVERQATGEVGPDLTHFASRRTLGAATAANNRGHLGGWLLDPQALKPGNRMPPTLLEPQRFFDLLDYMQSLH